MKTTSVVFTALLLVCLCHSAGLCAADGGDKKLNIFFIGNSFTQASGGQFRLVPAMLRARGHDVGKVDAHISAGQTLSEHWGWKEGEPGSPRRRRAHEAQLQKLKGKEREAYLRGYEADRAKWKGLLDKKLADCEWDWVVMQSWYGANQPEEFELLKSVRLLAERIRSHNPKTRIVLYMPHVWDPTPEQQQTASRNCRQAAEENELLMAAAGECYIIARREHPDIYLWVSDTNTHPGTTDAYLIACTIFSVISGESPLGLPETFDLAPAHYSARMMFGIDKDHARIMQQLAWQKLGTDPQSGVTAPDAFKVVTLGLPAAVDGSPYRFELRAAFGALPHSWTVIGDALPPGLSLSPHGVIGGNVKGVGEYRVSVGAQSGNGETAEQEFAIQVAEDKMPEITTSVLPDAQLGMPYRVQLEGKGGNGRLAWAGDRLKLPPGMQIKSDGSLWGSPAGQGTFEFKVSLADSDPLKPDRVTGSLVLKVGPPSKGVIRAPFVSGFQPVAFDGKLDDACWARASFVPLEKALSGKVNNTTNMSALWFKNRLFLALRIKDESVVQDSENAEDDDSVAVSVDALNDRTGAFGIDDRRIVVKPSGDFRLTGGDAGLLAKAAKTNDGYTVEVLLLCHRMGGKIGANQVIGLEVRCYDDDDGGAVDSRLAWQGGAESASDTRHFGSLIMLPPEE